MNEPNKLEYYCIGQLKRFLVKPLKEKGKLLYYDPTKTLTGYTWFTETDLALAYIKVFGLEIMLGAIKYLD